MEPKNQEKVLDNYRQIVKLFDIKIENEDTFNPADVVNQAKLNVANLVKNDQEYKSEIKKELRGEVAKAYESRIKDTFNLSAEEMKDKNYDQIIALAWQKASSSLNDEAKEYHQKNIRLSQEVEDYKVRIIPEIEAKVTNAQYNLFRSNKINKELSQLNLVTKPEVVTELLMRQLDQQYQVNYDIATDKLDIRTKLGTPVPNANGTKELSSIEVIKKNLEDLNLLKLDKLPETKARAEELPKVVPNNNSKVSSNYLKAQRHLAEISSK